MGTEHASAATLAVASTCVVVPIHLHFQHETQIKPYAIYASLELGALQDVRRVVARLHLLEVSTGDRPTLVSMVVTKPMEIRAVSPAVPCVLRSEYIPLTTILATWGEELRATQEAAYDGATKTDVVYEAVLAPFVGAVEQPGCLHRARPYTARSVFIVFHV